MSGFRDTPADGTLQSCPQRRIAIVLLDAHGRAVPDAEVLLSRHDEEPIRGRTDELGRFFVEPIEPGAWTVDFPGRTFDAWHRVSRPVERPTWIDLALVDAEGRPVPDEPYRVTPLAGGDPLEGTLDARGRARVDVGAAGLCKVGFPARGPQEWWPVAPGAT